VLAMLRMGPSSRVELVNSYRFDLGSYRLWIAWCLKLKRSGLASDLPAHREGLQALESETSPQANLAIARDALLLVAAEEMSEVLVGEELVGVGFVDRQDLRLVAGGSER
jgi:hypothetical protein